METKQTTQMITWLDEERRKDKTLISKLEERTISQAALLEEQARRIHELEGQINRLQSSMPDRSTYEEALERTRTELVNQIDQQGTRRETGDQELRRARDQDRETMFKALEELKQEFNTRLEREMQPRRAEEERLSRVAQELQNYADNLSKGFEDFQRSLTFLEEQRRQDSRRLSDTSSEIVEIAKRVDGQTTKVELLEELSRRNERGVSQLNTDLRGFKEERQAWVEQQALLAQEREQTMNEMMRKMSAFSEEMETYAGQFSLYNDTHRSMKKQVEDFDRVADRVDRRLGEVAEMQRLSEDRFRQEWESFLQEDQKRWRQFTISNEEARREQGKETEDLRNQLARISDSLQRLTDNVDSMTTLQRETLKGLLQHAQAINEMGNDILPR
jgi:chromosome segregation ATPase